MGYGMDSRMTHNPIERSLLMGVKRRKPDPGLIHHSDRDSQYSSKEYQKLLKALGMTVSMGRKGNPYENAPMELHSGYAFHLPPMTFAIGALQVASNVHTSS
ncbi:MAG: DDE-type integrase/transposase/recombinase [Desulfatiglandales bacterium]